MLYVYFVLKNFLGSYVGMWGNNGDAGIPPPLGRVKDRGGIRAGAEFGAGYREGRLFV